MLFQKRGKETGKGLCGHKEAVAQKVDAVFAATGEQVKARQAAMAMKAEICSVLSLSDWQEDATTVGFEVHAIGKRKHLTGRQRRAA